jgi:hypothetical protein
MGSPELPPGRKLISASQTRFCNRNTDLVSADIQCGADECYTRRKLGCVIEEINLVKSVVSQAFLSLISMADYAYPSSDDPTHAGASDGNTLGDEQIWQSREQIELLPGEEV